MENLVVICDLPDNEAAAAFSLAISNSGAARAPGTPDPRRPGRLAYAPEAVTAPWCS